LSLPPEASLLLSVFRFFEECFAGGLSGLFLLALADDLEGDLKAEGVLDAFDSEGDGSFLFFFNRGGGDFFSSLLPFLSREAFAGGALRRLDRDLDLDLPLARSGLLLSSSRRREVLEGLLLAFLVLLSA